MGAPAIAPPRGMRSALAPVLQRCRELDSPRERRHRAATLRMVTVAFRGNDLAAVGVRELEQLADELDGKCSR